MTNKDISELQKKKILFDMQTFIYFDKKLAVSTWVQVTGFTHPPKNKFFNDQLLIN